MKKIQLFLKVFLIPLDFLISFLSFLFAYYIRLNTDSFFYFSFFSGFIPPIEVYLFFVLGVSLILIVIFGFYGLYDLERQKRTIDDVPNIVLLIILWLLLISSFFFWNRSFFFSRFVLVFGSFLTLVLIVLTRVIFDWFKDYSVLKQLFQKQIVLIGVSQINQKIKNILEKNGEYKVVKVFEDLNEISLKTIKTFLEENKIFEIIQTDVGRDLNFDLKILDYCQLKNLTYRFTPNVFALHSTNIDTRTISGMPIIELKPTPLEGWGKIFKRIFDICFSVLLLLLLSPVFFITAVLVKLSSSGPVFVGLDRVRYNQKFKIYKFRSMIVGAHQLKKDLINKNERNDGPLFKMKNDPRITNVGKFLRKTRLDELPQFWNVLKGDMSVVGPRPHEPEEVEKYQKHHRKLLAIKPGITGMAQVHGASDLLFEEEVNLDIYYIENWTLWLDIKIIFKTIFVVLLRKGAA